MTPLEGRSLAPVFQARQRSAHPHLCWEHEGNRAVRQGGWKLLARFRGPWELYDLAADRTETRDLAATNPAKVQERDAVYQAWARRCGVVPYESAARRKPCRRLTQSGVAVTFSAANWKLAPHVGLEPEGPLVICRAGWSSAELRTCKSIAAKPAASSPCRLPSRQPCLVRHSASAGSVCEHLPDGFGVNRPSWIETLADASPPLPQYIPFDFKNLRKSFRRPLPPVCTLDTGGGARLAS